MPVDQPNTGTLPADGSRDAEHYLPDNFHINYSPFVERVEHRAKYSFEARPEHNYANDARHLPCLLRLLRLNQY